MSDYETIILSVDGPIATLSLNRPDKLNSIGGLMREEMLSALDAVSKDNQIRAVLLTGKGRGFCAGGDIENLKRLRETHDEEGFKTILQNGHAITRRIRSLGKPVVAAVNGPCAGAGFSLALACDVRIASEKASLGPTFALIGLHPDWGGSWLLTRLVGTAKACELVFRGTMISASEAEKIGLVNAVTRHEDLMSTVAELARAMAQNPAGVLRLAKESIYRTLSCDFETALDREMEAQMECFQTEDFLEGVTAFLEKRRAQFRGR